MDVTKSNFEEVRPLIFNAIESSEFVALDTELTGLCVKDDIHVMDSVQERYEKYKGGAEKYATPQLGLSCWIWSETDGTYVVKTFNFYLFPQSFAYLQPKFLCSASTLQFLASHNFDFNKFIYQGIPYINVKDATQIESQNEKYFERLLKEASESSAESPYADITVTDPRDIKFLEAVSQQLEEFATSPNPPKELVINTPNAYFKRITYQTLRKNYPQLSAQSTGPKTLNVTFSSSEDKLALAQANVAAKKKELEEAIGFAYVMWFLSKSKKPIVGHCLLFDLVHIFTKFFAWPAPDTAPLFKKELTQTFSTIFDTSYLFERAPGLKELCLSSALGDLFKASEEHYKRIGVRPYKHADLFDRYTHVATKEEQSTEEKANERSFAHEAGYDAFMTGAVFLFFLEKLQPNRDEHSKFDLSSLELTKHQNILYLMRSELSFDLQKDEEIDRTNMFAVQINPDKGRATTQDLYDVFYDYIGAFQLRWLNERAACVMIKDRGRVEGFVNKYVKNNEVKVTGEEERKKEAKSKSVREKFGIVVVPADDYGQSLSKYRARIEGTGSSSTSSSVVSTVSPPATTTPGINFHYRADLSFHRRWLTFFGVALFAIPLLISFSRGTKK